MKGELLDMDKIYGKLTDHHPRLVCFENPSGAKASGGTKNGGAKGSHLAPLKAGETKTLLNVEGSGSINRIFLTISNRSPEVLRSVKIKMYWDGCEKPAVSAPLGDFFGATLGIMVPFESCFLSNPEGRSFVSHFQMPFARSAKVEIINETQENIPGVCYDISFTFHPVDEILYFHCFWNRENRTKLAIDYEILPMLKGEGRFLGTSIGVDINKDYENSWFGEGEVKIFLDGDGQYPTICGTGTEDYVGSGWGLGTYTHMTQGCTVADKEQGKYAFYRFHLHDIIYFYQDIRVTIQNMGGAMKDEMLRILKNDSPIKITSHDSFEGGGGIKPLFDTDFTLTESSEEGWYNFYRTDDFSSCAYFYYCEPCVI